GARPAPAGREGAGARTGGCGRTRAEQGARVRAAAEAGRERTPTAQAFLMRTLAAVAPGEAVIVDESATSLPHLLRHLPLATPNGFFGSKTGTLGWAMGAALGVQLASPGRTVIATIGDGSVMYSPQALWTA